MALEVILLSGSPVASFEATELQEGDLQALVKERLEPKLGASRFRLRLLLAGGALGSGSWKELGCPQQLQVVVLDYRQDQAGNLTAAAAQGDLAEVTRILELPRDPNAVDCAACDEEDTEEESELEEDQAFTPLWMAAGRGHEEVVRLLLLAGADKDAGHRSLGTTPLFEAAEMGCAGAVSHLLEARADLGKKNCFGRTPLIGASRAGQEEVVKMLVRARADVHVEDIHGRSALMACLCDLADRCPPLSGMSDVVQCLVEAGASVNQAGRCFPLGLVASSGNVPILELLIRAEADLTARDEEGQTPLWRAAAEGHLEAVKYLLEMRASPNDCDVHGVSALVMAASRGEVDTVDYLIASRADLRAVDLKGRDAYWYAMSSDENEMADHLLALGLKPAGHPASGPEEPVQSARLEFPMQGP